MFSGSRGKPGLGFRGTREVEVGQRGCGPRVDMALGLEAKLAFLSNSPPGSGTPG